MWLRKGDRNTTFFHKMENSHKRRNTLTKIRINRLCLINETDIRMGIA